MLLPLSCPMLHAFLDTPRIICCPSDGLIEVVLLIFHSPTEILKIFLSNFVASKKASLVNNAAFSWGIRPMSDELLLSSVEEAHCLLSALHQTLSNLIPVHLRGLFEDKCIEVTDAAAVQTPLLWFSPTCRCFSPVPPGRRRSPSTPPAPTAFRRAAAVALNPSRTRSPATGTARRRPPTRRQPPRGAWPTRARRPSQRATSKCSTSSTSDSIPARSPLCSLQVALPALDPP